MVDLKYTQHRMATIAKLQKRIADMKPGETLAVAELSFLSLSDGFTLKMVREVVETYADLGVITVFYRDNKPFSIKKPDDIEVRS